MICANCQATVPEDSAFCLRCGTRLVPVERMVTVNGGKTARSVVPAERLTASGPAAYGTMAAGPGGKQAYTLSFQPLPDDRLRYRVARWVCEVAPSHPITEVQEGLQVGQFATFLALTPAEVEATRQRIQALGAHPALWRLAPATTADLARPERPAPAGGRAEWTSQKKLIVLGVALLMLMLFGSILWQHFQTRSLLDSTAPSASPTIQQQ